MAIFVAPEPPRPIIKHRKSLTYGGRHRGSSTANPSSPYKSPLPSKDIEISPSSDNMSLINSPPAASSSQLSSPPPVALKLGRIPSIPPHRSPIVDDEESMEVEDPKTDPEEEEDSEDEVEEDHRPIVHIEARLRADARTMSHTVERILRGYLADAVWMISGEEVDGWEEIDALANVLESVVVAEISNDTNSIKLQDAELEIHIYRMSEEADDEIAGELSEDEGKDEKAPSAASTKSLPSEDMDELWGNLVYPDNLKERLLQYIYSSMFFSDKEISSGVVNWSRLVLLHGPPGTGKTSLCRALAQKISIRLQDTYRSTKLVEINSHSLFSKWFSESGKLVQKLFSHVTNMADSEDTFVIIMIDEVESLTGSRTSGGSEPGDALRVVNAVLTQLDKLKSRQNVLVLTTSNLSHAIDNAFIDRADIKEFVPLPPPEAIYWMLRTCFIELMDKEAMRSLEIPKWINANNAFKLQQKKELVNGVHVNGDTKRTKAERSTDLGIGLARLALRCHEYRLSGRVLRRMPMMAHTRFIGRQRKSTSDSNSIHRPEKWLDAMEKFVEVEQQDRQKIGWDKEAMGA